MDMLISLYAPRLTAVASTPADPDVVLRKPIGPEHGILTAWVADHFNPRWAGEMQAALANRPVTAWIAVQRGELLGFCCHDATARGFVGPIGLASQARGHGLGAALLRASLADMRSAGYGYAVAGDVGEPAFFRRVAGAIEIPDSTPGLYAGQLGRPTGLG